MEFRTADPFSVLLFSLFALVMWVVCDRTFRKTSHRKPWTFAFVILIAVFALGALSGVVADHFFPLGPILFALVLFFGLSFALSSSGRQVAEALPLALLIGFQGFRVPLEMILHHWVSIETIPQTMTWTGQNWDILSGLVSIAALPIVGKNPIVAWIVNTFGFLLLLNVFRVVILSSPLPFSWQLENPLLLIGYFPYCLIGPLFVLPALAGHLLTYRKLWMSSSKSRK